MLLSCSIESDNYNVAIEKFKSVRISCYESLLYLYGFMLLSGSMESESKLSYKSLRCIQRNSYSESFLYLCSHIHLSSSIESDNKNGSINKSE